MSKTIHLHSSVSVIVPTLNEAENIGVLLDALDPYVELGIVDEILVADGGSLDGTIEVVRAWEMSGKVRLVRSVGGRGLAGDVLTAARQARGEIVVVMDADLSHPVDAIPQLVAPIATGVADMAVGSRYVPEGSTPDWPFGRRLLSRLGGLLAWPLTELNDPMSGYFAVMRRRLVEIDPEAAGFKIGLEIIAEGGGQLRLVEVPIVFRDRVRGTSKIGLAQILAYLRRLAVLAGGAVSFGNAARFAGVGVIGLFVDLLLFQTLLAIGLGVTSSHVASFAVATVLNYLLNSRWAFADGSGREPDRWLYVRYLSVCLLALSLRGGVLAGAMELFGWPAQVAIVAGVGAAAIVNYVGCAFFVFPSLNPRVPSDIRWRVAAIGVLAYVLVLRIVFIGLVDLLPEEAYYWNYAQHLDIGYLDHPPMVAWIIWLGTSLFGDNEFGVRIGSLTLWLATALFVFGTARNLFGKSAAFAAVLLVSALPFYFGVGLVMMPDAPLTAAWAGALFFLERSLLGGKRWAWLGVGICAGLGMLSKYSIALLGPATLLFLVLDPASRRWLRRPEPYVAIAIGAILFSPVIVWNLAHDWVSFAFQSSRRVQADTNFSLPALVGAVLLLLTPFGVVAAGHALRALVASTYGANIDRDRRRALFIGVFTLVPLSVFVAFSLFHTVKLNWTGPLWLATLPAIGAVIAQSRSLGGTRIRRLWVPSVVAALVLYGGGLHYLAIGLPLAGYSSSLRSLPVAWEELGARARSMSDEIAAGGEGEPVLIGMDTYFLASELAFYGRNGGSAVPSPGRGILGRNSLMYDYWSRAEDAEGKTAVLFGFSRGQIEDDAVASHFMELGAVREEVVLKDGAPAGRFFYRVAHGFRYDATRMADRGWP